MFIWFWCTYMKFNLHAQCFGSGRIRSVFKGHDLKNMLYNSYPVVHLPPALVLEHLVDGGQLSEILNPNLFQADYEQAFPLCGSGLRHLLKFYTRK